MPDYYIGLMSGTSLDGIDAVLVDLSGAMPELVESLVHPWPHDIKARLTSLASNPHSSLSDYGALDIAAGKQFALTVNTLLKQTKLNAHHIAAIGSHGQTVLHAPQAADPFSLQIGDPNTLSELTGITTVADFRRRDMAAGGQGAPLLPALHEIYFSSASENRILLNIGGIANITLLPKTGDPTTGFDTGPGNILLDAWIAKHRQMPFDQAGAWAKSGTIQPQLLEQLRKHSFFYQSPPKSTGREAFNLDWLNEQLNGFEHLPVEDVQATLLALTTTTIADAVKTHSSKAQRLLVCGGGAHNTHLLTRLQQSLGNIVIESTEHYGIHPDWVEAIAFAWFAKQTLEKKPANLPAVTGAAHPVILGGIYQA